MIAFERSSKKVYVEYFKLDNSMKQFNKEAEKHLSDLLILCFKEATKELYEEGYLSFKEKIIINKLIREDKFKYAYWYDVYSDAYPACYNNTHPVMLADPRQELKIYKRICGLVYRRFVRRIKILRYNKEGLTINTTYELYKRLGIRKDRIYTTKINIKKDKCIICGKKSNLEIDHIKPLSLGGKDVKENLQILCKRCHIDKTRKDFKGKARYKLKLVKINNYTE